MHIIMLLCALALLLPAAAAHAADGDPDGELAWAEARLSFAMNAERLRQGLAPLQYDPRLAAAARQRSNDQLGRGALDSQEPGGGPALLDLLKQAGYSCDWVAENLARANDPGGDAVGLAARALLASPDHRSNALSSNANVQGLGVAGPAPDGSVYVTQVLAHTTALAPPADASLAMPLAQQRSAFLFQVPPIRQ